MIIAVLFGLSTSTLLIFHIYLSVLNRTTLGKPSSYPHLIHSIKLFMCLPIENMLPPITTAGSERRLYYLGVKENLKEVFGPNFLSALLPVATR